MESFDIFYEGSKGVLYIEDAILKIEMATSMISLPKSSISSCIVNGKRIHLTYDEDSQRLGITLKVLNTPADRTYQTILSAISAF